MLNTFIKSKCTFFWWIWSMCEKKYRNGTCVSNRQNDINNHCMKENYKNGFMCEKNHRNGSYVKKIIEIVPL